ncbi:MAG: S1 RNA-binding domain-containing protein [Phycisphaerales bacterium]|nr:S1 RNA-binding domain-containing protein [Phycisphaerales bacterium]
MIPEPNSTPADEASQEARGGGSGLDPQLQAEIDAALGEASFEDMLEQDAKAAPRASARGARPRREGVVVSIRDAEVFIEFGPKLQGVCPLSQFKEPPAPGTRETFVIEREDANDGMLVCSLTGGVQKAQWETIDIGQVIEARCTGTNTGGLEMEVAGHPAFMPAGHVALHHVPDLTIYVGQKMPCQVMELDRARNRMVLSRRDMLEAERAEARASLLETLEPGQVLDAVITRVQPFGAFADIGGMDGLIHVSEMSWQRVQDPNHLVKVGDAVAVQILTVDTEHDPPRIALGMRQLTTDPMQTVLDGFTEGDIVEGTVTRLADFGCFVELAQGVDGLVHISQLSNDHVKKVASVVKEGQKVSVKILKVDPASRRIGLSIKQAGGEESAAAERKEDPMIAKLKAKFGDGPLKGGIG